MQLWDSPIKQAMLPAGDCSNPASRSFPPPASQVALSSFSYLFGEVVQYCQSRVSNIGELERK